jgi:hypothetical protein
MNITEKFLDELDKSREFLLVAIEPLPDEALLEKQAAGEWSVVDVLINLTAWEAELVTGLMQIEKNKRPERLLTALKNPQGYDKARYEETQDRDLDQVFIDLQKVRIKVEEWLLEFSERDLSDPQRYRWLKGKPLSEIIAAATFERENKFIPQLAAYAQEWLERDAAAESDFIPLTVVDSRNMDENYDITD